MNKLVAALGIVAVGFALPLNFTIDVCAKGTVIDVNTGEIVCVGPVVERGRTVNLETFVQGCMDENVNWHGIGEILPDEVVCW